MPADKPTELSRIKLKTWTRQPVPMISKHSAHSTSLSVGFRTLQRFILCCKAIFAAMLKYHINHSTSLTRVARNSFSTTASISGQHRWFYLYWCVAEAFHTPPYVVILSLIFWHQRLLDTSRFLLSGVPELWDRTRILRCGDPSH